MPANASAAADVTQELIDSASVLVTALARFERAVLMVGPKGIDYNAAQAPGYFGVDADGNISGFSITRAECSDVIETAAQLGRVLNNQTLTVQAPHYNRLRKLARARLGT